jgi:NAD-dependent SIR2 family protein deacetylase
MQGKAMRLVDDGPNLPDELVRAQERGEVLFVCGAGVSLNAGLPLFRGLVERIYQHLGERWEVHPAENEIMRDGGSLSGQYDRLLRALERRLVGQGSRSSQSWRGRIRDAVRNSLAPKNDADLTDHLMLLELSRDAEHRNRILTTNFDTLFERAWKFAKTTSIASHACQAMPQPKDGRFNGVLHLHGRLADTTLDLDDTDLVLTSAEFGDAYLRSGWASRYLYDVFRTHTLVLVGYSADDPPMRYLLEALEADRERFPDLKPVYAFAAGDAAKGLHEEALWRAKGIEPVLYQKDAQGSHLPLYRTIREWARYAEDPTSWRKERLTAFLSSDPASVSEFDLGEIVALLRHGDADRLLGVISPSAQWLPKLRERGVFADGRITASSWIVSRLGDPEMVRNCASEPVSEQTWETVEWALGRKEHLPPAEYRTAWRWIIWARRNQQPSWRHRSILLLNKSTAVEDEFGFRSAVAELFRPMLHVRRPVKWPYTEQREADTVTARSLIEVDFEVSHPPRMQEVIDVLPEDAELVEGLLRTLCRSLDAALDQARDAGFVEPYDRSSGDVPSIAEHDQNRHRGGFLPLVRLIAEVWTRLVALAPTDARSHAQQWSSSKYALFQRLHLHALVNHVAYTADEAADGLLDLKDTEFWSLSLRRETMRLMAERWNQFSTTAHVNLVLRLVDGPPSAMYREEAIADPDEWQAVRDRATFKRLARIKGAGGILDGNGREALEKIKQRHPDWIAGAGDRDDFSYWMTSSWGLRGDPSVLSGVSEPELVSVAGRLQREHPFESSDIWRALCASDPARALNGLEASAAEHHWDPERWKEFFWEATGADVDFLSQRIAANLMRIPEEVLLSFLPAATSWLQRMREKLDATAHASSAFIQIWDRLASLAYRAPPEDLNVVTSDDDVGNAALNEPGGQLAGTLFDAAANLRPAKGQGFSADFKQRFETAIAAPGRPGLLARAHFLRFLPWMFHIDHDWSSEHLIPLLTKTGSETRALWQVRLSGDIARDPMLFNMLKDPLLAQCRDPLVAIPSAEGLVSSIILPRLWKQQDDAGGWQIAPAEVKIALEEAPKELLHAASRQLWMWMSEEEGDPRERSKRWTWVFYPFFYSCWPQGVACRDQTTSRNLVQMAMAAEQSLGDALKCIIPILVPFDIWSIEINILNMGNSEAIIQNYSRSFIQLLNIIIDPDTVRIPSDLGEVLAQCASADSSLLTDAAYRRLHAISRRQSA